MSDCPKLQKCSFFDEKMANKPAMAELFKNQFCKRNFTICTRYKLSTAGKEVPKDLFPNHYDRVKELI